MNTSSHDLKQNSHDNFKTSQLFKNDNNDNNIVTKSLISSKDMISEISTSVVKKLKKSFINKSHKSHWVSDIFWVSISTAEDSRESHVNQNQKFQITDESSDEFKDKKNSENEESHQMIKRFLSWLKISMYSWAEKSW